MLSPIKTVILYFPLQFCITIFAMALISIVFYNYLFRRDRITGLDKKQKFVTWMLANYIMLVLFFTVFGRRSWDYYRYNFEWGYSYLEVLRNGNMDLAIQIGANIIIFIPIGYMSYYLFKKNRLCKGLLSGAIISVLIELLQLGLKRGTCELDDLVSNLTGTMIGCFFISLFEFCSKKLLGNKKGMSR